MRWFLVIYYLIGVFYLGNGQILTSINIQGGRFEAKNSTQLFKTKKNDFLVFGSTAHLGLSKVNFNQGVLTQLFLYSEDPDLPSSELQGAAGIAENDTTFVLIGQFEFDDENSQVFVVKITESGRVLWANKLSTLSNDFADKIICCKNGDYLISTLCDRRENNFGERISGSSVFRIDNTGNLLWYSNLDTRIDPNSNILSMCEIGFGNIVIAQNYSKKLSMIKLNTLGDSISGVISIDSLSPTDADYISENQRFIIICENTALLQLDTSFNVIQHVKYSFKDMNTFTSVLSFNDSTIAVGGKYQNKAFIMNIDALSFKANNLYYNSFFPFSGSDVQGMFLSEDTFYSLISNGFALSKHNNDLSHECFSQIKGSQIDFNSQTTPDFTAGHSIALSYPTFAKTLGIYVKHNQSIQASTNCLNHDLSIRTEFLEYENICRNIFLKFYIYNHGIQPVNDFKIKVYFSDTIVVKEFFLKEPIGSKTGKYVDFGEYYLSNGDTRVSYKVSMPNGQNDEFSYNDSFYTDFKVVNDIKIGIQASDTVCQNATNTFITTGPDGVYTLLKDSVMLVQGNSRVYNSNMGGGTYWFMYENQAGCKFYSESIVIAELTAPPTPVISISNDTLFTESENDNYWYFNNNLIDSNTNFFLFRGRGNYKVVRMGKNGCSSEYELKNFILDLFFPKMSNPYYYSEKTLFWKNNLSADVFLYSLNGSLLRKFEIDNKTPVKFEFPSGLYLVVINSGTNYYVEKIWLD